MIFNFSESRSFLQGIPWSGCTTYLLAVGEPDWPSHCIATQAPRELVLCKILWFAFGALRYVLQNPFNSHAGTVNVHYWLCGPLKVPFRTSYRLLANGKERHCTTVLAKGKLGSDFDFALPIPQPLLWYNTVGEPDYLPRQMKQTQHKGLPTKLSVPCLVFSTANLASKVW